VGIAGIDHYRERSWALIAHPSRVRQASFAHPAQMLNPFLSDVDSGHLRDMSLMMGVEDHEEQSIQSSFIKNPSESDNSRPPQKNIFASCCKH
jgi:hypothetical protein